MAPLLFIGCAAFFGLGFVAYLAYHLRQSRTEKREFPVEVAAQQTVIELREVETVDGAKVMAKLPVSLPVHKQVVKTEDVTVELTPEQKLRLRIVQWASIILGFFLVAVIGTYALYHVRGQEPPKSVEDWLNRLIGVAAGVVLTFLGSPAPEGQVKAPTNQPPASTPTPAGEGYEMPPRG